MMLILKAAVLGIVEGITEFLPISSTGHLIIVNQFISFDESFTNKFDVIIQLGAILAVVIYFKKALFPSKDEYRIFFKSRTFYIWKKIIAGVIPALIIGAIFHKKIESLLFNPTTVAIALILGGIILIAVEMKKKRIPKIESFENLSYLTAFYIGLIQCLAMIPGTSRSGATIVGALLLGCSRVIAVEFSFFLAIPTIGAATIYSIYKMGFNITASEIIILSVGFLVSFFVAWAVIAGFMNFISKKDFQFFGYYRILLGIIVLLFFLK
ncbi:MAG TPA: undecaprenyl-diphosphatase [Lentisphaeria bacterium]|nr:undecaprenyl-diphosphatase [Lentisphaeria bacterium]